MILTAMPVAAHAAESNVSTKEQLIAAMSEVGEGDVVALGGNITMGDTQLNVERSVTLDLNGKELKLEFSYYNKDNKNGIKLSPGVTLIIKDSQSGSGVLNITNPAGTCRPRATARGSTPPRASSSSNRAR